MKPVQIYRHDETVGPGYLADFLKKHNIDYDLIALDQGDAVNFDLSNVSAIAFLGGDASVNSDISWISDEINLIQKASGKNFPIFGHCFGAQLISKALGGEITVMPRKEIGWFNLEWVKNSLTQEWFCALGNEIPALHWHEYSLTVPKGAVPLYGTQYCPNQAFVKGNIYATTAHVEVDSALLRGWITEYGDDLIPPSSSVQTEKELTKDLSTKVKKMQALTDVLYRRWLKEIVNYNKT